ncbi:DUF4401 domain-containing protein [Flammeovirga sp. OC4]|uniref:DUF4401 domain-containing protein n=1 Tax=Flammeovirga sp. OC4 TaxID=1382345 RepID=UPI0005C5A8BE|nr:DUF4401 domain-containing protein [Flammeovirga sp. OC4]
MNRISKIQQFEAEYAQNNGGNSKINMQALGNELEKETISLSILMKVLIYLGGFFASSLFLIFIFILFFIAEADHIVISVLGFIFSGFGILIHRKANEIFPAAFSTFAFIIGQVTLTTGLVLAKTSDYLVIGILIALNTITIVLVKRYLFVFIATLVIGACCYALVFLLEAPILFHLLLLFYGVLITIIFTNEGRVYRLFRNDVQLINPLVEALLLVFFMGLPLFLIQEDRFIIPYEWVSTVGIAGLLTYFLLHSNKKQSLGLTSLKIILFVLIFSMPTLFAPYIVGCFYLLILGIINNHKYLRGFGVITLIFSISRYYYDLELTLLEKSLSLMISGVMIIVLYWIFFFKKNTNEKI